ncbi:MAG TPA: PEP-CTERM sorting domain-containing protein [Burkholderiaceae bacterium]|nr:PEP-CTERM sorting domain-containing protein [Burkholderiaceae bacterium]
MPLHRSNVAAIGSAVSHTVAALLLAGVACGAQAQTTFDFSYTASTGVLSGRLEGTLLGDNNTIVVSSIDFTAFNGTAGPSLPFVSSAIEWQFGGAHEPTISLDGSFMDIGTCSFLTTDKGCFQGQGFIFDTTGWLSQQFRPGTPLQPFVNLSPAFGNTVEPFHAANWAIAAIPEPSSYALMLMGLGAIGMVTTRRRRAT